MRSIFKLTAGLVPLMIAAMTVRSATPPLPISPAPTARQVAWNQLHAYAFLHFSVNTFTDKEWGYGDESPDVFNPTDFDPDQIATTIKNAGLTGIVLTCKHHDGFCLWPSKYTEHCVKNSKWKNGKGDVVRDISDACKRHGLKFGIYLSPWDRNSPLYGTPAYVTYYRNQLRELLTNYGPIFEVWWDGANGGDGWYGGAKETRKIDRATYYDWANTIKIVRELQPDACIFSDVGPDARWIGNEDGVAGDPCWQTLSPAGMAPGAAGQATLNSGERNGDSWIPAEADVSIRPGWFYHKAEDAKVKTPDELTDLYFKSVGRGSNLILNIPPDRRGRISDNDVASLTGWKKKLDGIFADNLCSTARFESDEVRGKDPRYAAGKITSSDGLAYFASDDGDRTPTVQVVWDKPVTFDLVRIGEQISLGQRVDRAKLETWDGQKWIPFGQIEGIGPQRLVLGTQVTTPRLRISVTEASASPAMCNLGVFDSKLKTK
jgi:alpha-L-fucosidase